MKLIATGNTAEVFDMENGTVCKLFKQGYDKNAIQLEINNPQIINKTALNTAKFIKQIEIEVFSIQTCIFAVNDAIL